MARLAVRDKCIAVLYTATMSQLTTQRYACPDALRVVGGQVDDDAGVGVGGEVVGGVHILTSVIERVGRRVA